MLSLVLIPLVGCSTSVALQTTNHADWIAHHGGLVTIPQARVDAIGHALASTLDRPVHFQILDTDSVVAFSFSDGSIFLSRALVAATTDDEIAAAIAHEFGHLLDDGHAKTTITLHSLTGPSDVESRADAIGCQLLAAHNIPSAAMATLLQKVAAGADPQTAQALHRRITLLQ